MSSHILKIIQEEDTLTSLSICYHFAAEYRHTEVAFSLLIILNRYIEENF